MRSYPPVGKGNDPPTRLWVDWDLRFSRGAGNTCAALAEVHRTAIPSREDLWQTVPLQKNFPALQRDLLRLKFQQERES